MKPPQFISRCNSLLVDSSPAPASQSPLILPSTLGLFVNTPGCPLVDESCVSAGGRAMLVMRNTTVELLAVAWSPRHIVRQRQYSLSDSQMASPKINRPVHGDGFRSWSYHSDGLGHDCRASVVSPSSRIGAFRIKIMTISGYVYPRKLRSVMSPPGGKPRLPKMIFRVSPNCK